MKIALIGGAGFIGSHLTRTYLDAGHDVLVIDSLTNGPHAPIDPRARLYQVDIRAEKLRTILQMERPDLVSHHAARPQELPTEQALIDADVHVRGLLNVLDSCVNASVRRLVFASGGHHLYGNVAHEQLPLSENAPLSPHSTHDICKATGEWYVRYYTQRYGLKHTILRYADVYGDTHPRTNPHIISYFLQMLREQRRPIIHGNGSEIRDYIFIDDVAQANLCLLTRGENCTLHISSGCGYTVNQIYMLLMQQTRCKIEPIYLAGSPLDVPALVLDNTLARQMLGWQPEIEIEEGVRRLLKRLAPHPAPTRVEQRQNTLIELKAADEDDGPITDELFLAPEATLSHAL